jgi:hypothetical protein
MLPDILRYSKLSGSGHPENPTDLLEHQAGHSERLARFIADRNPLLQY